MNENKNYADMLKLNTLSNAMSPAQTVEQEQKKRLMEDYMQQLNAQKIINPLAASLDFFTNTYRGGKVGGEGPTMTQTIAASQTPMNQQANMLGWMGKSDSSNINPLQLARFKYQQDKDAEEKINKINKSKEDLTKEDNKYIEKLSKRMGDTAGLASNLKSLHELIPDLDDSSSKEPIPGIGVGMSLVPFAALSEEGQKIRQEAIALVRGYIYLRSGKQINKEEAESFMKRTGMGWDAPLSSFRSGVKGLKNEIFNLVKNIEAGYSPRVVESFKSRGGITSKDLKKTITQYKKANKTKEKVVELKWDANGNLVEVKR